MPLCSNLWGVYKRKFSLYKPEGQCIASQKTEASLYLKRKAKNKYENCNEEICITSLARHGPYAKANYIQNTILSDPLTTPTKRESFHALLTASVYEDKYARPVLPLIERLYMAVWQDSKTKDLKRENEAFRITAEPS